MRRDPVDQNHHLFLRLGSNLDERRLESSEQNLPVRVIGQNFQTFVRFAHVPKFHAEIVAAAEQIILTIRIEIHVANERRMRVFNGERRSTEKQNTRSIVRRTEEKSGEFTSSSADPSRVDEGRDTSPTDSC